MNAQLGARSNLAVVRILVIEDTTTHEAAVVKVRRSAILRGSGQLKLGTTCVLSPILKFLGLNGILAIDIKCQISTKYHVIFRRPPVMRDL